MSNNYMELPMDTYSNSSSGSSGGGHKSYKQQDSLGHNQQHHSHLLDAQSQLDLENDPIEYMPNELDEGNIQGMVFAFLLVSLQTHTVSH